MTLLPHVGRGLQDVQFREVDKKLKVEHLKTLYKILTPF